MTAIYKDHFSGHATEYQKFRPSYPDELFEYLASLLPQRETAWDCATGNGQAAASLAHWFRQVIATDASDKQIANATLRKNVRYYVTTAEHTDIPDQSIDLITVAQALHWFDSELFFREAKRVLRPSSVIAVWCYKLLSISDQIDAIVNYLYSEVIGNFWPAERRFIDNDYEDIAFPFHQLAAPVFTMSAQWNLAALQGYLSTWSAVQQYQLVHGRDPVAQVSDQLKKAWGEPDIIRQVTWRLHPKIGMHH